MIFFHRLSILPSLRSFTYLCHDIEESRGALPIILSLFPKAFINMRLELLCESEEVSPKRLDIFTYGVGIIVDPQPKRNENNACRRQTRKKQTKRPSKNRRGKCGKKSLMPTIHGSTNQT